MLQEHRRVLVAVLSVVLVTSGAMFQGAAQAAISHKAKTPLQRGLAFYRGKTLTMINPGPAGAPPDLGSRLYAPLIASYLHATVNVEDLSLGATIQGQDALAAANPNGLTFGGLNLPADILNNLTNAPGLNFNPVHEAFIASTVNLPLVLVASPAGPVHSFAQVVNSKSNLSLLSTATGNATFVARATVGVFHLPVNIVYGYASSNAIVQGFLRGDGPLAPLSLQQALTLIQAGQATPILLMSPLPKGTPAATEALYAGTPMVAQVGKEFPPKTKLSKEGLEALSVIQGQLSTLVWAAPAKIASPQLTALRAAMKFAMTNPGVQQQIVSENLYPGYLAGGGPEAKDLYQLGLKLSSALRPIFQS